MNVRIDKEKAMEDVWCRNCLDLGIPDPTIIKGMEFYVVRKRRNIPQMRCHIAFICVDCFQEGEIVNRL